MLSRLRTVTLLAGASLATGAVILTTLPVGESLIGTSREAVALGQVAPRPAAKVVAAAAAAAPAAPAKVAPKSDRTAPADRAAAGPARRASAEVAQLLDERVPRGSRQAVLVSGEGRGYERLVAVSRWERDDMGIWVPRGVPVRGHIGAQGWGKQREGDYRTPVGTYTLTAAGGYLPAPEGTQLPYDYRPWRYLKPGSRFADYVVRINWNVRRSDWDHVPADTPSIDWNRGSGIWLHVDSRYDTPTAGCVSVPIREMRRILRWLDPAYDPVIVLEPGPRLVRRPW